MSLILVDGFDTYATADVSKRWPMTSISSFTPSIISGGRNGGNQLNCAASGTQSQRPFVSKSFTAAATLIVGFFYQTPGGGASRTICGFYAGSAFQGGVSFDPVTGLLRVVNAAFTFVGTSTTTVSTGVYVELKITFADSGAFDLRINGVSEASGTSDFKNGSAPATADTLQLGNLSVFSAATAQFDDLYLCDAMGSTNNDFLGDCRVDALYPTGAGNYTQFTPSAGANWETVDDATPNGTDYVDSSTVGHRDSYAMGNLTALASSTVFGVQISAAAKKDNSGSRQIRTFVRSGGTDEDGAAAPIGTSQAYVSHMYELDPNGSVAWTQSAVNALEAGVAVAA